MSNHRRKAVALAGVVGGYVLYRLSQHLQLSELALEPRFNRLVLYAAASIAYLLAMRPWHRSAARPAARCWPRSGLKT